MLCEKIATCSSWTDVNHRVIQAYFLDIFAKTLRKNPRFSRFRQKLNTINSPKLRVEQLLKKQKNQEETVNDCHTTVKKISLLRCSCLFVTFLLLHMDLKKVHLVKWLVNTSTRIYNSAEA